MNKFDKDIKAMFAIFNPSTPQPPGGFCLSVFVIVRRSNSVLVGKIANPETWKERWGLDLGHPERWTDKWQIPATFLKIGEHPDEAANRICREQLGLENYSLSGPKTFVSSGESSVRPGMIHSDLFFVYTIEYHGKFGRLEHFTELHFEEIPSIKERQFGRGHDEVLKLSGYY